MKIDCQIGPEPIVLESRPLPGCGAVARFDGVVRGEENGSPIRGLEYEAYESMARRIIDRILQEQSALHPCEQAVVRHRTGLVLVGEAAMVVEIQSKHRAEAFQLLTGFMDRFKTEVPIWKKIVL